MIHVLIAIAPIDDNLRYTLNWTVVSILTVRMHLQSPVLDPMHQYMPSLI